MTCNNKHAIPICCLILMLVYKLQFSYWYGCKEYIGLLVTYNRYGFYLYEINVFTCS